MPDPQQGKLVLVVDDEQSVVRTVTSSLAMSGFRVIVAEDGIAGLEAFLSAKDEIDLVLADVVMPVMNGLAMVERICAIRPTVPVLLMSGYSDAVILTLDRPHHPSLRKPSLPDDLMRAVRATLNPPTAKA